MDLKILCLQIEFNIRQILGEKSNESNWLFMIKDLFLV